MLAALLVALVVLGIGVSAGVRFATGFSVFDLVTAVRIQRHLRALAAQCPAVAVPPNATALPIHVTRRGDTGPKVLMIHGGVQGGIGGGPATFAKQAAWGDDGWQVLLPDRPGFGQSPTRGPDDMEGDAAWVADMLGDGAHLVGHSFGGADALLAAARRPEAVRSLVLVEPALIPLLPGSDVLKADARARADFLRMGRSWLAARTPEDYATIFLRSLFRDAADAGFGRNGPQEMHNLGCSLLRARFATAAAMRKAAETVAAHRIPTLVVSGGWSPTFDAVGEIAARLTHGRLVIVPAPNHFVQLVNADEFNRIVTAFMTASEAGPHESPR